MKDLASFRHDRVQDIPVVTLEGEIDLSNAARLRSVAVGAVQPVDTGLVLDLTSTAYLDSAAIRAVLDVHRDLEARRQRLALVAPAHARVTTVLVLTGVPRMVPITDDVVDAVQAVRLGAVGPAATDPSAVD